MCFSYFGKDVSFLILNLFISQYLDQIPQWTEMKEEFSVKLQVENLLLLKIKIKQNPECPNKEYIIQSLSTFIRISGLNLEVKKSCIDQ